jgi:hypothetical protein
MLTSSANPVWKLGRFSAVLLVVATVSLMEAVAQNNRSVTINTAPVIQIGGGHAHVGGIHGDVGIRGSGKQITEERKIGTFTALNLSLTARVEINAGRPLRMTVTGDDNLLPLVLTEVRDRTLSVRAKEAFSSERGLVVVLDVPSLASVRLEGAGELVMRGLSGSAFSFHSSGACNAEASGTVEKLDLVLEGSSDVDFKALSSASARIKVNGSATCSARVRQEVEAIVDGVGEIRLYGRPPKVQQKISGVGEVILVDDEETPAREVPPASSAVKLPDAKQTAPIVEGETATYAGAVVGQSSNQAAVISASGTWEGTVKKSANGETAAVFDPKGDLKAIIRTTGKQTAGVFSPTGTLNAVVVERTDTGAASATEAPEPAETPSRNGDKRTMK